MSGGALLTLGGGGRNGGGGMLGGRGPGGKNGGILAGVGSASEEECSEITCRGTEDVTLPLHCVDHKAASIGTVDHGETMKGGAEQFSSLTKNNLLIDKLFLKVHRNINTMSYYTMW